MADKGWIKTYRKIQECWIWLEKEPFDKRSAWIDLLLTANHADKKLLFNGELITVKRGQILTSVRKLSGRWKWSVNKVYRFLELLISDEMLQKESDNSRTLLTIVNYSVFQDCEYTNEHSNGNSDDTPTNTPSEHKQECKECKEDNNNIIVEQIKEIVEYLNLKCGTHYRHTTANTKKHIKARLKDGYSFEDFKDVIDKKYKEWKGTEFERYLAPDTLFGTKFEKYLNQKITTEKEEDYESESSVRLW